MHSFGDRRLSVGSKAGQLMEKRCLAPLVNELGLLCAS